MVHVGFGGTHVKVLDCIPNFHVQSLVHYVINHFTVRFSRTYLNCILGNTCNTKNIYSSVSSDFSTPPPSLLPSRILPTSPWHTPYN